MYSEKTANDILDEMLANVRNDVDKREGSIVYDMLAPSAHRWELVGFALDAILELGFIDTANGEYIDKRASEQGLTRKPAEHAKGTVTITGEANIEVPAGFIVFTDDGLEFSTDEIATIGAKGTVDVPCTAIVGGLESNVAIKAITQFEETALKITAVTNNEPFSGGIDEESDNELKNRYLTKVRNPVGSGNVYHYQEWALSVSGVTKARVFPLWNGNGTVKVVVTGQNGRAPSEEILTAVRDAIAANAPIGATVTVVAVKEIALSVSATVELLNGATVLDVQDAIKKAIDDYITEALAEGVVRVNRVGEAILSVDNVADYGNIKLNGSAANIPLNTEQSLYLSEVKLT